MTKEDLKDQIKYIRHEVINIKESVDSIFDELNDLLQIIDEKDPEGKVERDNATV